MINKVTIKGDLLEVETEVDGVVKVIKRHVANYSSMTEIQKEVIWHDMADEPFVEFLRDTTPPEVSSLKKVLARLRSFL